MSSDDREVFKVRRDAGLAKRHEQRLENATYTAAEVKVLTETASKVALELGRRESRGSIVADLRFLAEARKDYCHRCPETQNEMRDMGPSALGVHDGHATASWLADIIEGSNDAMGWLPSWRWDEWTERRNLASLPSGPASDAISGVPRHSEVSEAPKAPQGCPGCGQDGTGLENHNRDCPQNPLADIPKGDT
jgi:hypothetical protein